MIETKNLLHGKMREEHDFDPKNVNVIQFTHFSVKEFLRLAAQLEKWRGQKVRVPETHISHKNPAL